MAHSLTLAALLCLTTWMSSLHTTDGQMYSCCLKNHNTRIAQENIVSYMIHIKGFCPITSVVFLTKRNKKVCWDPEEPFAQRAMRRLSQVTAPKQHQDVATTPEMTYTGQSTTQQLSIGNSTQTGNSKEMLTTAPEKAVSDSDEWSGRHLDHDDIFHP